MMSSEIVLRAWLVDGNSKAEFFLADIWRMLGAISGRAGCHLSSLPMEFPCEYRAILPGAPPVALRNEVGVHRAQWVPHDSHSGRVETSLVGVELLSGAVSGGYSRPEGPVLKTYNYPQRRAILHPTGEKFSLDAVLSGETG